jgi:hypothetical protein
MPDPLDVLPHEVWVLCILFAIDGQEEGPRKLLALCRRWNRHLLDTPSLWRQIFVQNGENENARISAFLRFSKGCSLHVEISTMPLNLEGLKCITDHSFRVATISIRPGASAIVTASHVEMWNRAVSYVLAMLGNGRLASDVTCTSCIGISLRENNQLYYRTFLMQFTFTDTRNRTDMQNHITSTGFPDMAYHQMWEKYILRCVSDYP